MNGSWLEVPPISCDSKGCSIEGVLSCVVCSLSCPKGNGEDCGNKSLLALAGSPEGELQDGGCGCVEGVTLVLDILDGPLGDNIQRDGKSGTGVSDLPTSPASPLGERSAILL